MTRICIAEDDPDQRERMRIILESEPDFSVVTTCSDGQEALAQFNPDNIDILLTDINMPGIDGLDLIQHIHAKSPDTIIIALTVLEDVPTVIKALSQGASGYLLKTESASKLCESLREALNGGATLSPKIARAIINQFQAVPVKPETVLTAREKEILRDAEAGYSYKETAERLSVSVHTVHHQVKNIFQKLHASNKMEALLSARKKGLL